MITIIEKHRKLSLSNYKGRLIQCPNCGKVKLKPYAYENGQIENDRLGRCQREVNCGYHLKPSDYFKESGKEFNNHVQFSEQPKKEIYTLPKSLCEKFIANYQNSTLFQFLQNTGIDFSKVFETYKVGSTKHGATIYFQFDGISFRAGKAIKYLENGHRDKSALPPVLWVHRKFSDFNEEVHEIRQCFFGRHLIDESEIICIVESEKTALICAGIFPDSVWMATGGRTQLTGFGLSELSNKKVFLFPDSDSVFFWQEKTRAFGNCQIVDLQEFNEQKKQGADIADCILEGNQEIRERLIRKIRDLIQK